MPELTGFPTAQQAKPNSCWACAARMIHNWYQAHGQSGGKPAYNSDQALANAWATAKNQGALGKIDVQRSAAAALDGLGYTNGADGCALPTPDEIRDQMNQDRPLLSIVGNALPQGKRNLAAQNGHWVVIVGISQDGGTLQVFDPEDGQIHNVAYNAQTYQQGSYWQNTSYVDPQ